MGKAAGVEARKIIVENVNVPGYKVPMDAERYEAMKQVLLRVRRRMDPGHTQTEMVKRAADVASRSLFPGRGTVQWWVQCAHLDLETK